MDRQIVYPGAIPLETDLLNTNKNAMIGLSKLAAAILGTSTFMNGLACSPTGPASLQVYVAPGEIYSLQNIDGSAYSSIAADTTHAILKQGISLDQLTLSCPAPVTPGQSINYLIQASYQDTDAGAVVLPYYNASNPSQAYAGPANSGTAQNTVRKGVCAVSAKAGVSATTGSQTTPAPDAGYTGGFVITVAYGQTQITAPNISTYAGAPFIPSGGLIVGGLQNNICNSSTAGGTADALTGSYFPGISALPSAGAGVLTLYLRAASANATTTPTFTPNSGVIAAKQIVKGAGSALSAGDIAGGGHWIELQYDATLDKWVILNPATGVSNTTVPPPAGSITGMLPTAINGTNTTAAVTVSSGQAADSTGAKMLSGPGHAWSVSNGNAANGYQGGTTLPNSSTIHFFECWGGSGYCSFASTSLTPAPPAGYNTYYRRIFSLNTTAAGALVAGNVSEIIGGAIQFSHATPTQDFAGTAPSANRQLFALNVPTGVKVGAIGYPSPIGIGNPNSMLASSPDDPDLAVGAAFTFAAITPYDAGDNASSAYHSYVRTRPFIITNTAGQIGVRFSVNSGTGYWNTYGFIDFRRA